MTDHDRFARNAQRLAQCHPVFAVVAGQVIATLEHQRFRPRIQHAWRSVAEQQALKAAGTSKLAWGFHNCSSPTGEPESLAVDVIDDDHPLASPPLYTVALARAAHLHGLRTGIDWGLERAMKRVLADLIQSSAPVPPGLKIGWDPTHLEWAQITVAEAKRGVRPLPFTAPEVEEM